VVSYPAPPPPGFPRPRRRHSRWLTVGLPIGVVLFLGGCGAVVTLLVTTVGRDVEPAQRAASSYAQALVDQRFAEAQHMMCARDQAAISPAALAEHYFRPELTAYKVDGLTVTNSNGSVTARADVRFTTTDGLQNSTDLLLVKENGTWRPCP
jgi:hypothetical protein